MLPTAKPSPSSFVFLGNENNWSFSSVYHPYVLVDIHIYTQSFFIFFPAKISTPFYLNLSSDTISVFSHHMLEIFLLLSSKFCWIYLFWNVLIYCFKWDWIIVGKNNLLEFLSYSSVLIVWPSVWGLGSFLVVCFFFF